MKTKRKGWVVWSISRVGVMIVILAMTLLLFIIYRYVSCINAADSANQAAEDLAYEIVKTYTAPIGVQAAYILPSRISSQTYKAAIVDGKGLVIDLPGSRCGLIQGGAAMNIPFISFPEPLKDEKEENVTLVIRNLREGVLIGYLDTCNLCLNITEFHYDAAGPHIDDELDLNDEYVVFENQCEKECVLTGWTVKDRMVTRIPYVFPELVIASGSLVTLHSGQGIETTKDLYWDSRYLPNPAIWNNDGDTLYLRDSFGYLMLEHTYTVP